MRGVQVTLTIELILDLKELDKIACLTLLFGFIAPVLGIIIKGRPNCQRVVFGFLCLLIPSGFLRQQDWGLTLGSLDAFFYRGHSTGYHFYFAEAFALALVIGHVLENWREFRLVPPGLWLYLLHCTLSFISIVNAPSPNFVCMAAFKAVKVVVVFVAAYHFFHTEKNVHLFLLVMVGIMALQLMAVIHQRYVLGIYQVAGTFEHQNALSMFASMMGLFFLAVTLGPKTRWSNLYLAAYVACAFIQQSTFSRAGMVLFAAGSATVAVLSLVDKVTTRRLAVLGSLGVIGLIGIVISFDTITARFRDYGNMSSGKTRELLNQAARDMVEDYPLGIGWNNFAFAINRPFSYGRIIDEWELEGGVTIDPRHQKGVVESLYFLLLAETGWQGLFSYLLFMLLFLWWNFRAGLFYRYQFLGAVSLGIACGCGSNYLHSLLERVLIQPRNMMLWMLLLGLTARIHSRRCADLRRARFEPSQDAQRPLLLEEPALAGSQSTGGPSVPA